MLNIENLSLQIEEYEFLFLVAVAVIEIGIDLVSRSKRDYKDTGANVAMQRVVGVPPIVATASRRDRNYLCFD